MNSLALLARRYNGRAVSSSLASSTRNVATTDVRGASSSAVATRPRRSHSISGLGKASISVDAPVSRSPSSTSASWRSGPRMPSMPESPPSLPSLPRTSVRVPVGKPRMRRRIFLRCYAIIWQSMRTAWLWILPKASHSRLIGEGESDDDKPAVDDTDESEKSVSDTEAYNRFGAEHRVGLSQRRSSVRLSFSLPSSERHDDIPFARPPRTPYPPDSILSGEDEPPIVSITPATPLHESKLSLTSDVSIPSAVVGETRIQLPLITPSPQATDIIQLPHDPQPALLPNPLSSSLLTSAPSSIQRSRAATPPRPVLPFHLPKTLVLDLDETLIHSTSRPMSSFVGGTGMLGLGSLFGKRGQGPGHQVEVIFGGRSTLYHVYKRPFVDYFLRKVSGWYTLVIFTASMQEYADPVIDWLDAGRGLFVRRLFRESCTQQNSGSYIKDLTLVDEDLSRVCLIDNSPASYNFNPANGIPIEGWISDPSDEALLDLLPVLDSLRFTSDVRRVLGIRGF